MSDLNLFFFVDENVKKKIQTVQPLQLSVKIKRPNFLGEKMIEFNAYVGQDCAVENTSYESEMKSFLLLGKVNYITTYSRGKWRNANANAIAKKRKKRIMPPKMI